MAEVYHNNIIDIDLESGTLFRSFLNHTIGSGDNNANWYGVRVFRKGEPITLSGCSVQGLFMPASGAAILISDGTHTWVSGNEAAVLLPQACYNVKGRFTLTIKIIGTNSYSITDTVRIIDGVVADTYSENPVAPTAAVPTYQEILAVYAEMQEDVADYESVVANQNQQITDLNSAVFRSTDEKTVSASSAGWRLNIETGLCYSDAAYQLKKYKVAAGDVLLVISDDSFQFQTVSSVPSSGNSNRIGVTYGQGDFAVIVPESATYLIVSTKTNSNASVYSATSVTADLKTLKNALEVSPDPFDNLIAPIDIESHGLKWNNGVLENYLTDAKTNIQLYIQSINASGGASTIGTAITTSGKAKVVGYLTPSVKYIQLRHNGSSQDLYARFPVNIEISGEYIISFNITGTQPNIIGGIKISDVSVLAYLMNKYTASISELHHLIIPNDELPLFIKTSSGLKVRIKISESDAFRNYPDTGKTKTPTQVLSDIPDNSSYEDGILTFSIVDTQALFYDFQNNTIIVSYVGSNSLPMRNCVVLVANWYGNIYGDWVNHAAYRNEFIKPIPYLSNGVGLSYVNRMDGSVDIYISTSISFMLAGGSTVTFDKSTIVSQLSPSAQMDGDNVKISLKTYKGLFYDAVADTLVIDSAGNSMNGRIPLLYNAWDNLSGPFLDYYFRNKISETQESIDDVNKIVKLPVYYEEEINDTANKLAKFPCSNFNYLVFTDIHYSYPTEFTPTKLHQFMESVKKIANGSNIDAVVFLGDIIEGGSTADRTDSDNQINAVFEGLGGIRKPVLSAFGNHDNNMYDFASADSSYKNVDHYIVMNEWKNKAVFPFGIANDYYYKDFPDKNIRVIVVNACDYRESIDSSGNVTVQDGAEIMIRKDQLDAIATMMYDSQYDMIVFAHGIVESLLGLISEYNSRETYTKEDGSTINFSGKTNKILLYHTGHYHNNAMEYVDGYNVNFISTSCASMAMVQQTLYKTPDTSIIKSWEDKAPVAWNSRVIPRIKGTANETCFDVVSIGNGKINKIGFGASSDGVLYLT